MSASATTTEPLSGTADRVDAADRLARRARSRVERSDFAGAERLLVEALERGEVAEEHVREPLYVLAVAQRFQQRPGDALATLEDLLKSEPDFGRGWQERGHTLLALQRPDEARLSFEQSLRHNPALPGAWRKLVQLYGQAGLKEQQKAAQEQLESLLSLPRELLSVTSMLHEGRLYRAERLCRHFLRTHPNNVEGMRLLALLGSELNVLPDAEFLLESCLEFEPDNDRARYDYANLLLRMQKFELAHEQCRRLVRRDPDNLAYKSLLANAAAGLGDHAKAIGLYNEVLERSPRQNKLLVMRGHAEKTVGRVQDAVESYRAAYRLQDDYGDAYWSLANLKNYRFEERELERMTKAEARSGIDAEDRIHLCFALGKAWEDREEWRQSFECYDRGNRLQRQRLPKRSGGAEVRVEAQRSVCTREFFEERTSCGHDAPDPIFIVGMPRAGSTLLEQILASHSRVTGTYELPHVIALAQRLRGGNRTADEPGESPRYPQILAELEHDYFRRFGERYIEDTRIYRHGHDRFIDKNPNNFFHVGLIRLMLPRARVIDARRHPMACCFSGFKQLFGQGQEFSYGLERIGSYYRGYVELMDHWDRVLPGFVLRVQYEDVVADLENQVRRVLDFCGLDFEASCLKFHRTQRSVRTPSSEQVRQPIYRSGLEQWRHYEPWLDPLKRALGASVRERYGIAAP